MFLCLKAQVFETFFSKNLYRNRKVDASRSFWRPINGVDLFEIDYFGLYTAEGPILGWTEVNSGLCLARPTFVLLPATPIASHWPRYLIFGRNVHSLRLFLCA
jgi:hypothetical protein